MDRRAAFLSLFDPSGFGLEIGPSYNPLLPKADGYNVEVLDHASQDGLREKYSRDPAADVSRIEAVDYVSDGRPMRKVIGETGRYDFIVASHVIEHTPDMIGFLQDCESLLRPGGVLALAVPDMRFCFDRYKSPTSLGEIIEAHVERRTRHTRASLFDHGAYFCEVDGASGWPRTSESVPALKFDLHKAMALSARHDAGAYIDNHGWQFVPSSFRMIAADLHELGKLQFREAAFQETDIFEMFVIMSATGAGPGLSRTELLRRAADELAAVSDLGRQGIADRAEADRLREEVRTLRLELTDAQAKSEHGRVQAEREQVRVIEQLRQEVDALRASTSWRITRPLRSLRGG
jgi:SAM-dependent methyltransferase